MHDVSAWVGEGRIKYREDVVEGLGQAPRALIGLLRGENFGKLLVRDYQNFCVKPVIRHEFTNRSLNMTANCVFA